MFARYTVLSHRRVTEDSAGKGVSQGSAKGEVEEFVLSLESHKMPIVEATCASYHRRVSELLEPGCGFRDNARAVVAHVSEDVDWSDAEARVEYLTTRCPYCGSEGHLEHGRWRVYVGSEKRRAHVINEPSESAPENADRWFSDYPDAWMPFAEGSLVPLEAREEDIEKPYGESHPLEDFIADVMQPRLPLYGMDEPQSPRHYGRIGGYKGIYECPHCASAYYVVYNNYDLENYVEWPADEGRYGPTSQALGAETLTVAVLAAESSIELRFSPAAENRVTSIRFDTKRGFTEVDGYQLMKQDVNLKRELARLPLGVMCPPLFSYVARCLEKRIANADHASRLVCDARKKGSKVRGCAPGLNVLDLAFANRLQGYPDDLYRNLFTTPRYDSVAAPFAALPIRYADIATAYDASGLPQCKSIRRISFRQPLFISYAHNLDRIPFSDPNLLRQLLSDRAALRVLNAQYDYCGDGISVFEFLRETRGELGTWNYLKKLIDAGNNFDFLFRKGERRIVAGEIGTFLASQKIAEAARTLSYIFSREMVFSRGIQEAYSYSWETAQMEGDVGPFSFWLPRTPLDLLKAGMELRNCLADYVYWIDDERAVLIVSRAGSPVGAVEVKTHRQCVVQAKARFNKEIVKGSALESAFAEWMCDKRLHLDLDSHG